VAIIDSFTTGTDYEGTTRCLPNCGDASMVIEETYADDYSV
jgi:hypothetical protein